MDNAIRNALLKKRKLLKELSKIDSFIEYYEELSGNKVQQDELLTPQKVGVARVDSQESAGKQTKRRNNIAKLLDVSERLIREAGRPLTRGEIAEGMERLNVVVHSDDIPKYLGTLLWRNNARFISVEGAGYDLPMTDTDPEPKNEQDNSDPLRNLARIVAGEEPQP